MCEACLMDATNHGEVVPGLFLVEVGKDYLHAKKGDYGLVRSNDPDVIWSAKPIPDPWDGLTDDEINDHGDLVIFDAWVNQVEIFQTACQTQLDLTTAIRIGLLCADAGYDIDEDGILEYWLFHRMALLLRDAAREVVS